MKRIIIAFCAICMLCGCANGDNLPTEAKAVVYRCDNTTDTVYCETADGNCWTFYGYGYTIGQQITIVINDGCVVNTIN